MPKWHFTNKSDFSFSPPPALCLKMLCWGHPGKLTPCGGEGKGPERTLHSHTGFPSPSPRIFPCPNAQPRKYLNSISPRCCPGLQRLREPALHPPQHRRWAPPPPLPPLALTSLSIPNRGLRRRKRPAGEEWTVLSESLGWGSLCGVGLPCRPGA